MTTTSNEPIWNDVLILNRISSDYANHKYVICKNKKLYIAQISLAVLRKFDSLEIEYGTFANCRIDILNPKTLRILQFRQKSAIEFAARLDLEFLHDPIRKKHSILCSALTNGCFTYENIEYSTPAVYNNILGIINDRSSNPMLPKREIGRLTCLVSAEEHNGTWQFYIDSVKSFEMVLSSTMSAQVESDEHFGLVTREETDEKRDLRLVSSRDFPRDVRIFKSGLHCCEAAVAGSRSYSLSGRFRHDHDACVDTGVGYVRLLGKSVAMKVVRCRGMGIGFGPSEEPSTSAATSSDEGVGYHVDGRHVRVDVTQLEVHVHGGFVEVETICEYSGYTDHNDYPLLWSHDVEFVVDFSKIFKEKPFGLYIVNAVRFHRQNVFAKWRLARRAPIVKSLQTKFHSRLAHSLTLGNLNIEDMMSSEADLFGEFPARDRIPSVSRFGLPALGNIAEGPQRRRLSCSLPRTDSMDQVPLFDALLRNTNTDNFDEIDDTMWKHHDRSVINIVDDSEPNSSKMDENWNMEA
ncbi:unnamed protein product [Caenorhabditis bovis]|uniref:Uncharacterized protein n=1 Tax=Caenorhabditis bovis TaxID=2654633 RepID=A0A8S1F1D4_9PELO|nr:unnamed protein product [Caenorhabditis bovis]